MKKPPTSENTTHDPDDAPAERALQRAGFGRVREYDDTGRMLQAIQATAQHHTDRHPDDLEAQGIAAILTAMEHAHRNPDDDDVAQRLRAKVGEWSARGVKHSSGLVRTAREYTEKPGRGPRTRRQQANMLRSAVAHGLRYDWDAKQIAERFIMVLRTAPDIAKHTRVPMSGEWHDTDADRAAALVQHAIAPLLEDEDAKTITRAALVALHCPNKTAHNICR